MLEGAVEGRQGLGEMEGGAEDRAGVPRGRTVHSSPVVKLIGRVDGSVKSFGPSVEKVLIHALA